MTENRFGPPPPGQLKLFGEKISGHCHRVELFLHVLGLQYECIELDLHGGEGRSDPFKALNPLMQIPVLRHGERLICDSNAILCYLATEFKAWTWWPRDPVGASQVQRWLSLAAGELVDGPVTARRITVFKRDFDQPKAMAAANHFLGFLDGHLRDGDYLLGKIPTVADIAIYTYTAHAPEGAVSLQPFDNVRRWLSRVEEWPEFVAMPTAPHPSPLNL